MMKFGKETGIDCMEEITAITKVYGCISWIMQDGSGGREATASRRIYCLKAKVILEGEKSAALITLKSELFGTLMPEQQQFCS